jgi:hypothetical protein
MRRHDSAARWALCAGVLAASLAAGACDGVGGALIGKLPAPPEPPEPFKNTACPTPPSCTEAAVPLDPIAPRSNAAIDLTECRRGGAPRPICPDGAEPPAAASDDAGVELDDADAGLAFEPGPDQDCEPLQPWQSFLDQAGTPLSCIELGAQLEPAATAAWEIHDLRLNLVNLVLQADQPVTLRLLGPSLRQTSIELRGPIRLELAKAEVLDELRVRGAARAGGAPSLQVLEGAPQALVVGSPQQPFAGAVELVFVTTLNSQLTADSVTLRSSTFYDGRLDAAELQVVDSELDRVTLRMGDGRIEASVVTLVEVTECGSLGLFGTSSKASVFSACAAAPLRVYQSNVTDGLLDGVIDTEVSDLCNVRLGQRSPTTLWLWSGSLLGSSLCQHAAGLVVGGRAARNGCEGPPLRTDAVCAARAGLDLSDNLCAQLQTAQPCEALPPHERPEQDRDEPEGTLRNRD